MSRQNKVIDVVCKMDVELTEFPCTYMHINYSFCSQQCLDRFTANPYLYIKQPGNPSLAHDGENVIKRRLLKLDAPIPDEVALQFELALSRLMGVKKVQVDNNTVDITYDLLELTTVQIEQAINKMGGSLADNWGELLKRAFIHYFEDTRLDILEQQQKTDTSCSKND